MKGPSAVLSPFPIASGGGASDPRIGNMIRGLLRLRPSLAPGRRLLARPAGAQFAPLAAAGARRSLRSRAGSRGRPAPSQRVTEARKSGNRRMALGALQEMQDQGASPSVDDYVDAMILCSKDGAAEDALELFESTRGPGDAPLVDLPTHFWNALLMALEAADDASGASGIFERMQKDPSVAPDALSYHIVMSAAIRGGQWETCLRMLGFMRVDQQVQVQPFSYFLACTAAGTAGRDDMVQKLVDRAFADGVILEEEMLREAAQHADEAGHPAVARVLRGALDEHGAAIREAEAQRDAHRVTAEQFMGDLQEYGIEEAITRNAGAGAAEASAEEQERAEALVRQLNSTEEDIFADLSDEEMDRMIKAGGAAGEEVSEEELNAMLREASGMDLSELESLSEDELRAKLADLLGTDGAGAASDGMAEVRRLLEESGDGADGARPEN